MDEVALFDVFRIGFQAFLFILKYNAASISEFYLWLTIFFYMKMTL